MFPPASWNITEPRNTSLPPAPTTSHPTDPPATDLHTEAPVNDSYTDAPPLVIPVPRKGVSFWVPAVILAIFCVAGICTIFSLVTLVMSPRICCCPTSRARNVGEGSGDEPDDDFDFVKCQIDAAKASAKARDAMVPYIEAYSVFQPSSDPDPVYQEPVMSRPPRPDSPYPGGLSRPASRVRANNPAFTPGNLVPFSVRRDSGVTAPARMPPIKERALTTFTTKAINPGYSVVVIKETAV